MDDEPSPLAGKLEPETSGFGDSSAALYSIAISLKRIADMMQNQTLGGGVEDLAYNAGVAFARGNYAGTNG